MISNGADGVVVDALKLAELTPQPRHEAPYG